MKSSFKFFIFFIIFVASLSSMQASATTYTATATATWATAWGGPIPTLSDTCIVNSNVTITVNADAFCGSLTVGTSNQASTITLNTGNLTIAGNVTLNAGVRNKTYTIDANTKILTIGGTWTPDTSTGSSVISVSTGQVKFTNAGGISWPKLSTLSVTGNNAGSSVLVTGLFTHLTGGIVSNTGTAGTLSFNGGYTNSGGTMTTLSGETINVTGTFATSAALSSFVSGSIVNVNGNLTATGGALTFAAGSTVNFITNSGTITPTTAITFGNLVLNPGAGNTTTLAGNVTLANANSLTVSSGTFDLVTFTAIHTSAGGALTVSSGAALRIGGTNIFPTNYSTISLNAASTVDYYGTAQTVLSTTYGNLTLSGSGVKTMPGSAFAVVGNFLMSGSGSATLAANAAISGNLSVTAGTLDLAGFTANRGSAGGTLAVSNGALLRIGTAGTYPTQYSTNTLGATSTVEYYGTGATQAVTGVTYGNLTLSGSGIKTMPGSAFVVGGNFAMSGSGTATLAANVLITGDLSVTTGTLDLSTFTANRASAGGTLTVANGALLKVGGTNTLPTNYATTTLGVSSTVEYSGTAQSITADTYGNLTLSGSGAKTIPASTISGNFQTSGPGPLTATASGALVFAGNFTIASGTIFDAGSAAHSIKGNFVSSGTFTPSTSTFTFNGTSPQTISGTPTIPFNQLVISGTAAVTTSSALTVGGNFIIAGTSTFNAGSLSHTIAGNLTNAGGFVPGTSSVTFNGISTSQIIGDTTFNNLVTGGTVTLTAAGVLTVNGNLTLATNTTFVAGNYSHILNGNFTNSGLLTAGTGSFIFSGTGTQVFTAAPASNTVFNTLTLSNSAGLQLADVNSSFTVGGFLNFVAGKITPLAGSKVIFGTGGSASGYNASRYIVGAVKKFYSGTGAMVFPIGDATFYTPATVTGSSGFGGGSLTVSVATPDHPNLGTSGIVTSKSLNRYWTVSPNGLSGTYDITLHFTNGISATELDSGANTASFIAQTYTSSTWSSATSNTSCTPLSSLCRTVTATTVTANQDTAFALGEAGANTPLQCYTDPFSNLTNWTVGSQGTTTFVPDVTTTPGRLTLTNTTQNESTFATLQRLFPAFGNKVVVEFKHYAGGGSGADGLGVVLSDASIAPSAGAFGGSLGYAPKRADLGGDTTHVGFTGGWLGIGIDEFGNFSANTEGRTGGPAPGLTTDSVAIRGSGSGYSGYPYITGTGTLTPAIDADAATGNQYRIIVDHSDGVHAYTSVERDTGSGYTFVIPVFDSKTVTGQAAVPTNWLMSYASSTGGSTNTHQISNLQVCSNSLVPISLHHLELDHHGTACGNEVVTVKACADAACSSLYLGNVATTLSITPAGIAAWQGGTAVTIVGGQSQFTVVPSSTGSVTIGAAATSPLASNVTMCSNGAGIGVGNCGLTFVAACFDAVEHTSPVAAPATPIYTKISGIPFTVDILSVIGGAVNTAFTGSVNVDFVDPTSPTGNCSDANPSSFNTVVSPAVFAAGNSGRYPFTVTFNGAAPNLKVRMIYGGQTICSKDNFAIRPAVFGISSTSTLSPTYSAGVDFNLTATPLDIGGTARLGYTGRPVINSALVDIDSGHTTPVTTGTFTGNFVTATGGNASGTFQYNDVGNLFFAANSTIDTSFTAVDQVSGVVNGVDHGLSGDCVANSLANTLTGVRYGCNIGSNAFSPAGQFIPHHYDVNVTPTAACNNFTYMGQKQFGIALTVEAMSLNETRLVRYTTGFSGLSSIAVTGIDGVTSIPASRIVDSSSAAISLPWVAGLATSSALPYSVTRGGSPDGPYDNFKLNIAITDPVVPITNLNGAAVVVPITSNVSTVQSTSTIVRYGRLLVENAFGSNLLNLPVNLTAQYWNGSSYVTNTLDSNCESLSGQMAFRTYYPSTFSASLPATKIQNVGAFTNGAQTVTLVKPNSGASGGVDFGTNTSGTIDPYLPGVGRETFGIFNGGPVIYRRELY